MNNQANSKVFDHKTYWNNRLKGDFGLEAVGYIGLGRSFNHWMYKVREYNFLRHIRKTIGIVDEKKVLDIGSGTGFYIDLWRRIGVKELAGVDISKDAVLNLRKKYPQCKFDEFDLSVNVLPENEYDIVSCMDVLFHITDDASFLFAVSNICKSLTEDGYLVFTDNFLQNKDVRNKHHVSRTLELYESILSKNNMKIVGHHSVFYLMNHPIKSNNYLLKLFFSKLQTIVSKHELLGHFAGMRLFPFEILLTRYRSPGPSTDIMICKKVG